MSNPPSLIQRISIRNYKSLAKCVQRLGSLHFLIGPNAAGKSNFLDALRFMSDALNTTLEQALRDRGGIGEVRRNSRGHPTHFGIRLDLALTREQSAWYAFRVGAKARGGLVVQREECHIPTMMGDDTHFIVEDGRPISSSVEIGTALVSDRLALTTLSGRPEFRPVYDALRNMAFYNLNPQRIRDLQDPDPGQVLARDGRNLASVIRELRRAKGGLVLDRIVEHLRAVMPGVTTVEPVTVGPKETIRFRQIVAGDKNPWKFPAASMSDGTLRALGIFTAVFQSGIQDENRVRGVGIEEPEVALHPGAAEVVAEALHLASQEVQVLVTTHSPEILDHKDVREEHLLAVSGDLGNTIIGPVDRATKVALRDRLFNAGELLVQGQVEPDSEAAARSARQLKLFHNGVSRK
jgi:predicted ATPase